MSSIIILELCMLGFCNTEINKTSIPLTCHRNFLTVYVIVFSYRAKLCSTKDEEIMFTTFLMCLHYTYSKLAILTIYQLLAVYDCSVRV